MESNGFENFIGSDTADGDGVPQIPPIWLRDTKLLTLRAAVPQGLLVVTLVMLAVVFKYTSTVFDTQCSNLSVLLFYQAALWLYALGIHHFYEVQHARLRRRGYQAFYKHLRNISSFQFIIISWWNVLTVVYLVGSLTYTVNTICDWNVWYSAINLTVGSICVHGIITLTLIISYSRDVIIFNRSSHYASDIEAIEVWRRDVTSMVHSNVGLSEEVVQLVEKQAYLIEFYQNRIKDMSAWLALRTEDRQSRHPN